MGEPDDAAEAIGRRLRAAAHPDAEPDVDARAWRSQVAARLFGAPATRIRIGRYEVVQRIGGGATGVVYEAQDPELERRVAIKLLRPDAGIAADQAAKWLAREAKTLARLSHPNVVPVYDVGTHDDRVFIALEYVAGRTMRAWLSQPRTWSQTLAVFVQAAQGLAAAHAAGLVHRDFKPDNVLIGDDGRVRVSDFGIARRLRSPDDELGADTDPAATEGDANATTHRHAGTPSYMAPEQFLGDPVDARTDQFGWCVALHEALYGERPFAGTTRSSLAANVTAGRRRAPPAGARVPTWLDRVIARGLRVDPAHRFASMDALLAALQRRPSARRLAIAFAFAGGIGTAAFVGSSSDAPAATPCDDASARLRMVWSSPRAADLEAAFLATDLAGAGPTAERVAAGLDAYGERWRATYAGACEGVADEIAVRRLHCLQSRLLEFDSLVVELQAADRAAVDHAVTGVGALVDPRECNHVGEARDATLATSAAAHALRKSIAAAKAKHDAGRPREALPLARAAADRAQDLGDPALSAEALLVTGQAERTLLGTTTTLDDPQATVYAAVLAAQAAGRPDLEARAMVDYLGVCESGGQLERALEWAPRVREAVARVGDPPELSGRIDYSLSIVHSFRGDDARAREHAEASLRTFSRGERGARRWAASSHNMIGELVFSTGDYAGALPHYERALDITLQELGPEHPWAANCYGNMAEVAHYLGRHAESDELFRRALSIRLASYGPRSIWVIHGMAHVADTAMRLGRPEEAREIYAGAIEQREALRSFVGDRPRDDSTITLYRDIQAWDQDQWLHYGIALAELELGDVDAAERHAATIVDPRLPDDAHHPDQIPRIDTMGWVRLAQGRPAEAAAEFRAALVTLTAKYPSDHHLPAFAAAGLGLAEVALGRPDAAAPALRDAVARLSRIPDAFPRLLGDARFALADASWNAGDLDAARAYAEAAHDDYRRALDRRPGDLDAVATWLTAHAGPD